MTSTTLQWVGTRREDAHPASEQRGHPAAPGKHRTAARRVGITREDQI